MKVYGHVKFTFEHVMQAYFQRTCNVRIFLNVLCGIIIIIVTKNAHTPIRTSKFTEHALTNFSPTKPRLKPLDRLYFPKSNVDIVTQLYLIVTDICRLEFRACLLYISQN